MFLGRFAKFTLHLHYMYAKFTCQEIFKIFFHFCLENKNRPIAKAIGRVGKTFFILLIFLGIFSGFKTFNRRDFIK